MVCAQATAACSVTRRNSNERSDSIGVLRLCHEANARRGTASEPELRGCIAGIDGDLEVISAAEQCAQFTGRRVSISGDDSRNVVAAHLDCNRTPCNEMLERLPIDVGDQVTETIDAAHLAGNGV